MFHHFSFRKCLAQTPPLFLDSTLPAWSAAQHRDDAARTLVARVKAYRQEAKVWKKKHKTPPSIYYNCRFLILLLDLLEEAHSLCAGERLLRTLCQDRLVLFVQQRAAYWKQRGKFRMIREGDANTKFFHVRASQRPRRNKIQTIVDAAGQCHVSHAAKSAALTAHFSSLFGEADSVTWDFDGASL